MPGSSRTRARPDVQEWWLRGQLACAIISTYPHKGTYQVGDTVSESIEMYLVTAALERRDDKPVPLSVLAEKLCVSPVSVNEMCHRMTERGLVEYQPYKGIVLTSEGERVAQRVLVRRRIWATFLQQHLGLEQKEAQDIACQLEHIASDRLTEALATYLGQPLLRLRLTTLRLSMVGAGQWAKVLTLPAEEPLRNFLVSQGITRGTFVRVLAVGAEGTILLDLMHPNGDGNDAAAFHAPCSISAALAEAVEVILVERDTTINEHAAQTSDLL